MVINAVLLFHRYLGVVLGLLMTCWCLSGFVMMYQPFPTTSTAERVAGLDALDLDECCDLKTSPLADDDPVGAFRVEMLNGRPVMRVAGADQLVFGLRDGVILGEMAAGGVRDVVSRFAEGNAITGKIESVSTIIVDQWTPAIWRSEAPLWRAAIGKRDGGTFVYVAGKTGLVLQDASPRERLINWFGAIPHWLYPTLLRQNGPLYTQVVIWSALLGTFLTVTGIVIGVVKLRGASGRWFPYRRPAWLLHHMLGIVVGLFLLTWMFSGLLMMRPWAMLTTPSSFQRADLVGQVTWKEARTMIANARGEIAKHRVVQLRGAPLLGRPYLIALRADGSQIRLGADGAPAPFDVTELNAGLSAAKTNLPAGNAALLTREDSYYYAHHGDVKLPAIRLLLEDKDRTRVYLDADTGEIARVVDATEKRYRWMGSALHSLDLPVLRTRPLWDVVVLLLLAAVSSIAATGTWLAFMRIGRDARALGRYSRQQVKQKNADLPA